MSFQSIGLLHKADHSSQAFAKQLFNFLMSRGFLAYFVDSMDRQKMGSLDLLLIVGGDGTFLRGVKQVMQLNIPVLGVNTGRLGYLSALDQGEDFENNLEKLLKGDYLIEKRMMLEVSMGGQSFLALNEFVIHRQSSGHMIEFDVNIGGNYVFTQRSDGLIISTPTGSTAYSLSAGGPLIQPDLSLILLVSVCPHALSQRPLVIGQDQVIELNLHTLGNSQINIDGQQPIDCFDHIIRVQKAAQYVSVLQIPSHDHYGLMRQKLKWSTS